MVSRLRSALAGLLIAGAALLLGLTGTTLRTGWIAPLDWLLPAIAALVILIAIDGRRGERASAIVPIARRWLMVALPIMAFCLIAGAGRPWAAIGSLGLGLALAAGVTGVALGFAPVWRWLTIAALLVAATFVPHLAGSWRDGDGDKPAIGVMTAMSLQGAAMGAAHGLSPMDSIGMRSPLWQALERRFDPRPLDALDAASLRDVRTLLLAQPRLLQPEELVALDAWVRRGGHVVILADPLLHWPDPRPLGHAARAPLTSLLDPLLSHWGLKLEPAEIDMEGDQIDRRVLANGALLQLSGASRFSPHGRPAGCIMAEQGLLAHCRIGQGRALLVADADWINDMLWTLDPARPDDPRAWTSDAVDLLDAWLRGGEPRLTSLGTWLVDREMLLQSLRLAFGILLLLVIADWLVARHPRTARHGVGIEEDQKWNINKTNLDKT